MSPHDSRLPPTHRYWTTTKAKAVPRKHAPVDESTEANLAREYYGQYLEGHRVLSLHRKLYRSVMEDGTSSAFEFGCNRGKNLLQLFDLGIQRVSGLDISSVAVELAQEVGLDVRLGDEEALLDLETDSVDCAFTCSVLCHIPGRIGFILEQLVRIARKKVVLAETRQDSEFAFFYCHDYALFDFRRTSISKVEMPSMTYELWEREIAT